MKFPFERFVYLSYSGKEMNGQTTSLPLRRCVFWMAVQRVVTQLGDHSWERQACIFVVSARGGSQRSLGCFSSYGGREMCCFHRVRGKVMRQHGWEGEMNGICYITRPVFQDLSLNFELPLAFTGQSSSLGQQTTKGHFLHDAECKSRAVAAM